MIVKHKEYLRNYIDTLILNHHTKCVYKTITLCHTKCNPLYFVIIIYKVQIPIRLNLVIFLLLNKEILWLNYVSTIR